MTLVYLTQALCNAAAPRERRYDLRDSLVRGLFLRVEVSGRKTWYLCYRTPSPERRLRNMKIASAAYAQLAAARRAAKEYLARLYLDNVDPAEAQEPPHTDVPTLRALIDMYEPWVCEHQKSGAVTVRTLRLFSEFLDVPAGELDAEAVALWREENIGRLKRATINRRVAALQALLAWGAKKGLCCAALKLPKLAQSDSKVVARFLTDGERARLMDELAARESRSGRDYLRPAVILSLNTGIRKGTLLGLRWGDVDFASRTLRLRAEIMKAGREAVVPLNDLALAALSEWRAFCGAECVGYVFPAENGARRNDTSKAFMRVLDNAGIKNFTWHCLRHDFASQLAMKGVPMHVIQKLMCHGSLAMTQRYAHLSPNSLEEAVRLIC